MKKRNLVFAITILWVMLITPVTANEVFWLDSYSPDNDGTAGPVGSDAILEIGVPYVLQVDGSYSWWQPHAWQDVDVTGETEEPLHQSFDTENGLVGMDITSVFALPSAFHQGGAMPIFNNVSYLQLSLDGGNNWFRGQAVEGQYKANHSYTFRIVGEGHPLQVQLGDSVTSDNYGQFRLRLYPTTTTLGDGLVAYYPFDGDANDTSGNERHGTEHGQIDYVPGVLRQAVQLNGNLDNYITVAHEDAFNFKDSFTISLWINRFDDFEYGNNVDSIVVGKGRDCFNNYLLSQNGTMFKVKTDGDCRDWSSTRAISSPIPYNEWHLVTAVFDKQAETIKYYLDGALKAENNQVVGYQVDNEYPLVIGKLFGDPEGNITVYPAMSFVDELRLYDRALSECEIKTLHTSQDECTCQIFAVHDDKRSDSQLLAVSPETGKVELLGSMKKGVDLESLAINSEGLLYTASGEDGNNSGYLYQVHKMTGELTTIGFTGFDGIDGLAFSADDTLWGWAQGVGLVTIDPNTAKATVMLEYRGEIEGLTWNSANTVLYGVENLHQQQDGGSRLWAYDINSNTINTVCDELMGTLEVEGLETLTYPDLPNDFLILGIHGQTTLPLIDPKSCQQIPIPKDKEIDTTFGDIEGIAIAPSCRQ